MRLFKPNSRFLLLGLMALSFLLLVSAGCGSPAQQLPTPSGQLKVTYINVGQGDAILVQAPSGKTLLIDGGPKPAAKALLAALSACGVKRLDSVIATHEDADHIGSLDDAIGAYPVGKVFLPQMPTKGTKAMEDFLTAVKSKGLSLTRAKAGVEVDLGKEVSAEMLGPVKQHYGEDNNYSVVVKLTFGTTSFLMTGDAEAEAEQDLIDSGVNLKSTVLKVGHHGSKYSTSEAFLQAVNPKYAVIQVGHNNYGHPAQDVINRLKNHGVQILRTDQQGTITAISNGTEVKFSVSAPSSTR